MERNRLMMIAAALAAVVVVAGGFFLAVQPKLSEASAARVSAEAVTTQNQQLSASLASLRSQFTKLDSLKTQLAGLQKSVPDDVSSGAVITELNDVAKQSGVILTNITIADAVAYVPPVASDSSSASSTATASASPSASASASAATAPVASTPASPTLTTNSLITAANFSDVPVTLTIQGTYAQALSFLQGIRDGKRLILITTLNGSTADGGTTADGSTAGTSVTGGTMNWSFGGLMYALTDAASAQQSQQTSTSTASGTTGDSSTDTAAGK